MNPQKYIKNGTDDKRSLSDSKKTPMQTNIPLSIAKKYPCSKTLIALDSKSKHDLTDISDTILHKNTRTQKPQKTMHKNKCFIAWVKCFCAFRIWRGA